MSTETVKSLGRGPFRPEHLRSGDPYELSQGHPVECLPQGGRASRANLTGGLALATDPDVESAGVDTGFAADGYTLRAPDLAVGNVPDAPGWVQGAPPLALEYADTDQDEADLTTKIRELFAAGTRLVWVARLTGPRRVEVFRPDGPPEVRIPGERLEAPGILRNPAPVEALFDRDAAEAVALRNLLQRAGYDSLEEVRAEAELATLRASIFTVLESRGLPVDDDTHRAIDGCADGATLVRWLGRVALCPNAASLLID